MNTYGLIGNPVEHSFSEKYFSEKFKREKISAVYKTFPLKEITEIQNLIQKEKELKGLNVTIPYKESILPFLDEVKPQAASIGAVNTIKFVNGKRIGYNSDAFGFMKSLFPLLEKQHTHALVLGTGGASKAVVHALNSLGVEHKMVSRSPKENQLGYPDLDEEIIQEYKLIINCTPLGTYPRIDESPAIPYSFLGREHLLYDLTYNPAITQFLAHGQHQGCKIFNGQKMLEYQAERSWEIWNEK